MTSKTDSRQRAGMISPRRLLQIHVTLGVILLVAVGVTTAILYNTGFDAERTRLSEFAKSQSRVFDAISHSHEGEGGPGARDVLAIIDDFYGQYAGFGETGEIVIGRHIEGKLEILSRHGPTGYDGSFAVSLDERAAPLRMALEGKSGTIVGPDYDGAIVLAAFEPLKQLNWGIVVKVDLWEIRSPYLQAASFAGLVAILSVVFGARIISGIVKSLIFKLEKSEAMHRAILETTADGIITIDERGRIESFNRAAEKIFGYRAEEVIGINVKCLMPRRFSEEHDAYLEKYVATGQRKIIGFGREVCGLRATGEEFPLYVSVSAVGIEDRRLFTGIVRDVSSQKEAERALRRKEALTRMGEMAAVVAHEVRNPLAAISGAVQVIGEQLELDNPHRDIVKEVLARIESLNDIVSELLFFARPREPQLAPVPLRTLVENTIEFLQRDERLSQVVVEIEGEDHLVSGDAELLKRAFHNFLLNSAQAMEGEGVIRIELSREDRACCILFKDSGPGIPESVLARAFEPFFSTKSRGSGLGLPTALGIVEAHQGSVSIRSPDGGGTEIEVHLPLIAGS